MDKEERAVDSSWVATTVSATSNRRVLVMKLKEESVLKRRQESAALNAAEGQVKGRLKYVHWVEWHRRPQKYCQFHRNSWNFQEFRQTKTLLLSNIQIPFSNHSNYPDNCLALSWYKRSKLSTFWKPIKFSKPLVCHLANYLFSALKGSPVNLKESMYHQTVGDLFPHLWWNQMV